MAGGSSEPEQRPQRRRDPGAEPPEDLVEDVVDRRADGIGERIGTGQVERVVVVGTDVDAVGREHEHRPALRVEPEPDAYGAARGIAGEQRCAGAPRDRRDVEPGQRYGGTRREVE